MCGARAATLHREAAHLVVLRHISTHLPLSCPPHLENMCVWVSLAATSSCLAPLCTGVLTETTAEIAAALTFAAARRVVEADRFMRGGHYKGWLPTLFIGNLLQHKTVRVLWRVLWHVLWCAVP